MFVLSCNQWISVNFWNQVRSRTPPSSLCYLKILLESHVKMISGMWPAVQSFNPDFVTSYLKWDKQWNPQLVLMKDLSRIFILSKDRSIILLYVAFICVIYSDFSDCSVFKVKLHQKTKWLCVTLVWKVLYKKKFDLAARVMTWGSLVLCYGDNLSVFSLLSLFWS